MNKKQLLAFLLAVSMGTAAASVLAEGSASGPEPEASDLPTAGAWAERDTADDAGTQYESVTGEWTLAELADMDAPPVTGDAAADDALERQWRALKEALENAPPGTDPNSLLSVAPAVSSTPASDGPALTGDAKTDSQLEAEWNAAHPAEVAPAAPEPVIDADDRPEASVVAGPDDGGIREEPELDKNGERDARKRKRLVASTTEQTKELTQINFEQLEERTREANLTVRAMRESVTGLENIDYKKSEDDLLQVLNGLSAQQDLLSFAVGEPVAQSFAISSLQTQYNSLYDTFEKLHDGTTRRNSQDAIRQMTNAMDQVVMGTETLYIALIAMQDQYTSLNRQLESLNRTVEELELRYRLGQISALTLNQTKAGRTALLSGMETLQMNIRTYKMQLENMLGASLTGAIELGALPSVTENQIAALDADRDFAAAHEKSYELYAAARTLQDAQETYQSSGEQYHYNESNDSYTMARHTWTAAQDTYNVTVRGYELKFRTLYEQVHDYYQVWNASKDALETQRQEYQATELQYKQGNISRNTLLSAQDSLNEKEEAVRTAANNLFSAYNNYCWAVQTGILA